MHVAGRTFLSPKLRHPAVTSEVTVEMSRRIEFGLVDGRPTEVMRLVYGITRLPFNVVREIAKLLVPEGTWRFREAKMISRPPRIRLPPSNYIARSNVWRVNGHEVLDPDNQGWHPHPRFNIKDVRESSLPLHRMTVSDYGPGPTLRKFLRGIFNLPIEIVDNILRFVPWDGASRLVRSVVPPGTIDPRINEPGPTETWQGFTEELDTGELDRIGGGWTRRLLPGERGRHPSYTVAARQWRTHATARYSRSGANPRGRKLWDLKRLQ